MSIRALTRGSGLLRNARWGRHINISTASFASLGPFNASPPNSSDQAAKSGDDPGFRIRRTNSPAQFYSPRTEKEQESVYVLTLQTDTAHHLRMTKLRAKHFKTSRWANLEAHLTLFHALPGSKLDDAIIPAIQKLASKTSPFPITAKQPFRTSRGVAILVPPEEGGNQAKDLHDTLLQEWLGMGFLSPQDAAHRSNHSFPHYTVANYMKSEEYTKEKEEELRETFEPDKGVALGFDLFLYVARRWRFVQRFPFAGSDGQEGQQRWLRRIRT